MLSAMMRRLLENLRAYRRPIIVLTALLALALLWKVAHRRHVAMRSRAVATHAGRPQTSPGAPPASPGAAAPASAPRTASGAPGGPARPRITLAAGQTTSVEPALGRGATLPGGCHYLDVNVAPQLILARYSCPGLAQPVPLYLSIGAPPGRAPTGSTDRFSLWTPPEFPAALREALITSIRRGEASFPWRDERAAAPR